MTRWLEAARLAGAAGTQPTKPHRSKVSSVLSVLSGGAKHGGIPIDRDLILDHLEERAAIREFDGGQTREEAEAGALVDIAKSTGTDTDPLLCIWTNRER